MITYPPGQGPRRRRRRDPDGAWIPARPIAAANRSRAWQKSERLRRKRDRLSERIRSKPTPVRDAYVIAQLNPEVTPATCETSRPWLISQPCPQCGAPPAYAECSICTGINELQGIFTRSAIVVYRLPPMG